MPDAPAGLAPGAAAGDCWTRTGVLGDGSCPALKEHAHCRNCPVYAAAAARLLDGPLPAGYGAAWAPHFARPAIVEEAGGGSAVIFRLGSEWFALAAGAFDEATELRTIHSLPHRRGGTILGLVNVRGELLICISLARLLGLEETAPMRSEAGAISRRRLLVVRHEGSRVAVPVEEVQGTHRYRPPELRAVPATLARASSAYTAGLLSWRERNVGLLDERRIVQAISRNAA
jgi:chemotaxis-related protein WspD